LGFFPEGAFKDYASRGQILCALQGEHTLAGYVAWRPSPGHKISVVHLCIEQNQRGKGLAMRLIAELVNRTSQYRGMGLWCRNDFPASKVWPHIGFVARQEKSGKSKDGDPLTYWWLDYKNDDLFTLAGEEQSVSLSAVLDANVFFDLFKKTNTETEGLRADWLLDEIRLLVTPELYNEIFRSPDIANRESCRQYGQKFEEVVAKKEEVDAYVNTLESILPSATRIQDRSDIRQMAWAIAGNATSFITRDDYLLGKFDEVYKATGLAIVRPSELIVQVDALIREGQYQRDRLAGTSLHYGRDQNHDEDELAAMFQDADRGERKTDFLDIVRTLRASPEDCVCLTVRDEDNQPLGILGYSSKSNGVLDIQLVRGRKGLLSASVVRYLLSRALIKELRHIQICSLSDRFFSVSIVDQLPQLGFIQFGDVWVKVVLQGGYSSHQISGILAGLSSIHPHFHSVFSLLRQDLEQSISSSDQPMLYVVERMLWPLEISDLKIPAFIMAIQPGFAQHLFDADIATSDLFGADVNLALNQEAVYYRSPRNDGGLTAPARLLWYVSQNKRVPQSAQLRASSRLEEVSVEPAKEAYRQFRRLGVFDRARVIEIAGGNPSSMVMALRFSGTLPLENPISWNLLQKMLRDNNIHSQLQSPVQIPLELYFDLRYPKNENEK
jgi:predicted nucleic acid-binding protein/GNAT superfamily N-acetyltransferase